MQMGLKDGAKNWTIKEQTVEDPVTNLVFQFETMPDGDKRLRIFGGIRFGNRELIFNECGEMTGAGTHLGSLCKPTWLGSNSPTDGGP